MTDGFTWRYLPHGNVAHALSVTDPFGRAGRCRCGIYADPDLYWLGTGTQDENDNAADLPRCRRCVKLLENGP